MRLRALGVIALGLSALGMTRAPTKSRFRVDQTIEQVLDASAVGGKEEHQRFSVSTFLTVTLTDSTGGKVVQAVVDSMRADSAAPVPPAQLDSARGTRLQGFMAVGGRIRNVKPLRNTPLAPQLTDVLLQLYPALKIGAKVGDGWADTTETTNPASGGSMSVRRVTTYKATTSEARDGAKALKIEAAFTSSVTGTQETPSGPATVEGSGQGTGAYYVGSDGHYLGGTSNQVSKLTVSGKFAPKPLPISLTETFSVSELR